MQYTIEASILGKGAEPEQLSHLSDNLKEILLRCAEDATDVGRQSEPQFDLDAVEKLSVALLIARKRAYLFLASERGSKYADSGSSELAVFFLASPACNFPEYLLSSIHTPGAQWGNNRSTFLSYSISPLAFRSLFKKERYSNKV